MAPAGRPAAEQYHLVTQMNSVSRHQSEEAERQQLLLPLPLFQLMGSGSNHSGLVDVLRIGYVLIVRLPVQRALCALRQTTVARQLVHAAA